MTLISEVALNETVAVTEFDDETPELAHILIDYSISIEMPKDAAVRIDVINGHRHQLRGVIEFGADGRLIVCPSAGCTPEGLTSLIRQANVLAHEGRREPGTAYDLWDDLDD